MNRRNFMSLLPAGLIAARSARAADAEVRVFIDERTGTISPLIHGHFIEHLGGVIYDGVWVGEDSKIPNMNGIRKALVDAMRPIGPTVMRWPGGCFADSYDWHDGVGPRAQRPSRNNFWASNGRLRSLPDSNPAKTDPNSFGTDEFLHFCRLINAEPYVAANVRGLTAKDFNEWVEYCNSPAGIGTGGKRRGANGDPEPFNVRYWGVGNESWGCGGEMTAEEYSVEFRKFTAWVPSYGQPLSLIASGPNGGDYKWSRGFFGRLAEKNPGLINRVWGWALHYYCGKTGKGDSLDFTPDNAYELLDRANRMDDLITRHWSVMAEFDREHRVKLVVDEWGAWHNDNTAVAPNHLFGSVPTMRDALIASITLDTFHRHADKVAMANAAQLINCIQTLFLADGDRFCVTPTYQVFAMYKDHNNGESLRTLFGAPEVSYTIQPVSNSPNARVDDRPHQVTRLAGSASRSGKILTITAAHTHLTDPLDTAIRISGGTVKSARATLLSGPDIHAHNDFSRPDTVKPTPAKVEATGSELRMVIPPASVIKIQAELS
jgi:alpha-N-arabinofuranosidase